MLGKAALAASGAGDEPITNSSSEVVKIQHVHFRCHCHSFSSTFSVDFDSHLFVLNLNEFQKKSRV